MWLQVLSLPEGLAVPPGSQQLSPCAQPGPHRTTLCKAPRHTQTFHWSWIFSTHAIDANNVLFVLRICIHSRLSIDFVCDVAVQKMLFAFFLNTPYGIVRVTLKSSLISICNLVEKFAVSFLCCWRTMHRKVRVNKSCVYSRNKLNTLPHLISRSAENSI